MEGAACLVHSCCNGLLWCLQAYLLMTVAGAPQVFFIRDGMQFPDLVHSLQPNPKTNIQEGWRIVRTPCAPCYAPNDKSALS